MKVRKATALDLPWVVKEGIKFLQEYIPNKYDPGFVHIRLKQLTDTGVIFITETDDGIKTGMIAGMHNQALWVANETELTELFWWVLPEYRSGRAGALLFKAFNDYGKEIGVNRITFSLLPNSEVQSLEKRGYSLKENAYVREV